MNLLVLLAQQAQQVQKAAENAPPAPVPPDQTIPPSFFGRVPMDDIWRFIGSLSWLQAVVFVAFGVIYLVYGWRIYKALVVINLAGAGLAAGLYLGGRLGSGLWGGLIGALALGVSSWPLMRYAISVLGALAGALFGAAVWRVALLPEPLIWAGGLAGFIAGGLLAFSSARLSIMLFTCMQGSAFVAVGVLSLLHDYPQLTQQVTNAVYAHVFLLPILLVVPTLSGMYMQRHLLKQENDWDMPE